MAANNDRQGSKGKATAKANATKRVADREPRGRSPKVPPSHQETSQRRYPGETPLTGEDRPLRRAGGKKGRVTRRA